GAIIMEQIFVIPGMGLLLLDAVNQRDYPIVTGVFLVVGVAVMLINLVVDISYGLLDPKVSTILLPPFLGMRSPCSGPVRSAHACAGSFARGPWGPSAPSCSWLSCSAASWPT